jgi:hypothetical protein
VCFGDPGFIAGDFMGSIYFSADGLNWQKPIIGDDDSFGHSVAGMAFGNGTFVALSGGQLVTSADGVNWTFRTPMEFPSFPRALAFGQDSLIVAGFGGEISQSRDLSIPELSFFHDKAGSANVNLSGAVRQRYVIQRSYDLFTWNDWIAVTNYAPSVTVTNLAFSHCAGSNYFYRARRE